MPEGNKRHGARHTDIFPGLDAIIFVARHRNGKLMPIVFQLKSSALEAKLVLTKQVVWDAYGKAKWMMTKAEYTEFIFVVVPWGNH